MGTGKVWRQAAAACCLLITKKGKRRGEDGSRRRLLELPCSPVDESYAAPPLPFFPSPLISAMESLSHLRVQPRLHLTTSVPSLPSL